MQEILKSREEELFEISGDIFDEVNLLQELKDYYQTLDDCHECLLIQ